MDRNEWEQFWKDCKQLRDAYEEFLSKDRELESARTGLMGRVNEFESARTSLMGRVNELESTRTSLMNRVKELESTRAALEKKLGTGEMLPGESPWPRLPTEKQMEVDSKAVSEIKEIRASINRLLPKPAPSEATEKKPDTDEKMGSAQQSIVLPRTEWNDFISDARRLVQGDEKLLEAYHRLYTGYEQLSKAPREEQPSKARFRGLFRREKPPPVELCPHCGTDLEPRDRFCRACGGAIQ